MNSCALFSFCWASNRSRSARFIGDIKIGIKFGKSGQSFRFMRRKTRSAEKGQSNCRLDFHETLVGFTRIKRKISGISEQKVAHVPDSHRCRFRLSSAVPRTDVLEIGEHIRFIAHIMTVVIWCVLMTGDGSVGVGGVGVGAIGGVGVVVGVLLIWCCWWSAFVLLSNVGAACCCCAMSDGVGVIASLLCSLIFGAGWSGAVPLKPCFCQSHLNTVSRRAFPGQHSAAHGLQDGRPRDRRAPPGGKVPD